jgi:hypothetical protein
VGHDPDKQRLQAWREAIEDMSDREVLTHIHADLLAASSMLGETDMAAEVRALGCKASALLGDEADEVVPGDVATEDGAPGNAVPDTAATRPDVHGMSDAGEDPNRMPSARPPVPEVGRGPP